MDMIWDKVTKSFIPLGIGEHKWFSTSHRRMEVGRVVVTSVKQGDPQMLQCGGCWM